MESAIRKLTVNLYTNDINSFKNIEDNFDTFINQILIKHIGTIIQRYDIQDTYIEIKNLNIEIDLNLFDKKNYDKESFINNIKEQLSFALKNEIETFLKKYTSIENIEPLTHIKYKSLENFLVSGILDWWIDKDNRAVIQNLYKELLTNKDEINRLTTNIFKKQDSINRFSSTISNEDIKNTTSILMNTDLNIIKEYSLVFYNYLTELKFFQNLNSSEIEFVQNLFLVFLIKNYQNFSFKELFIYTQNQYKKDLNFKFLLKTIQKNEIKNQTNIVIENTPTQNEINQKFLNNIAQNDEILKINKILNNLNLLKNTINNSLYIEQSPINNFYKQNSHIKNSYTNDEILKDLAQKIILDLTQLKQKNSFLLSNSNKTVSNILHEQPLKENNAELLKNEINTNFKQLKKQLIIEILNINSLEIKINVTHSLILLINSSYIHIYRSFINEINANAFLHKINIFDSFLSTTLSGIIENRTAYWYQIQIQNLVNKLITKKTEFIKEVQKKQSKNLEKSQTKEISLKKNNTDLYDELNEYFFEKKTDFQLKNILQKNFFDIKTYKYLISYINSYINGNKINRIKIEILIKNIISIKYGIIEKDLTKAIKKINEILLANKKQNQHLNVTNLNTLIFLLNQSQNYQNFNSIIENLKKQNKSINKNILLDNINLSSLINIISKLSNHELKIFFKQNLSIDSESIEIPNKIISYLLLKNNKIPFKELKELIWTDFILIITKENKHKDIIISKEWQESIIGQIISKFELNAHEVKKNTFLVSQAFDKQKKNISEFEKIENLNDTKYIKLAEELKLNSNNEYEKINISKEEIFQILKKYKKLEILKSIKDLKFNQQIIIKELKEFLNRNYYVFEEKKTEIIPKFSKKLDFFLKKIYKKYIKIENNNVNTGIDKNVIFQDIINKETINSNNTKNVPTNNKINNNTFDNNKDIDIEIAVCKNEITFYEEQYVFTKKILSFFTSMIKDVSPNILLDISVNKIFNKLNINDYVNGKEFDWKNGIKEELLQISDISEIQLNFLLLKIEKFIINEIIILLDNKKFKTINYPNIPLKEIENNTSTGCDTKRKKDIIKDYSNTKNKTLYLNNASIVILYPFIEDLFKQLHLLRNNKFKNEISHFNAIHIINYLCTNELFAAEWDMVVLKILLGFKPEEFVYNKYMPKAGSLLKELHSPTVEKLISIEKQQLEEAEKKVLEEVKNLIETCNAFILNIIKKWESLNALTKYKEFKNGVNANNFKEYFLYRTCIVQHIVETKEPFWHITIPLYAYDCSEIFPPWPLDFVVLPWTKEKVVINWI